MQGFDHCLAASCYRAGIPAWAPPCFCRNCRAWSPEWPLVDKLFDERPSRRCQLLLNEASGVRVQKGCHVYSLTVQSRMCHHPAKRIGSNN